MNHFYQIIKGKKLAVIHEYSFGVLNKGFPFVIKELNGEICRTPKHFKALCTIDTTDQNVIKQSCVPHNKLKDVLNE